MRIPFVLALCAVGAVVAFLLLRPGDERPPLPPVAAVTLDSAPLQAELAEQAEQLQAVAAVGSGQLDELLAQDPLTLAIPEVTASGVTARDVAVRRRGDQAAVEATVELSQLAALAPAEVSDLKLDAAASAHDRIVVRGTAKALGFSVPVTIRVHAVDGAVRADPEGLPIDGVELFSDPRVRVRGLKATPIGDGDAVRVRVTATVVG